MDITWPLLLSCIAASCANETSSRPRGYTPPHWTPGNPSFGHCAIASLAIQDYFGGVIIIKDIPKQFVPVIGFSSHAFNHIKGVGDIDATKEQFLNTDFPYEAFMRQKYGRQVVKRRDLLRDRWLKKHYEHFRERVREQLLKNRQPAY